MSGSVVFPLFAFVAAAGVLTITPGVDTAMVLRSSAVSGAKAGIAAGLGICGGLLVWGVGAAFGLTALLAASEIAFTALKWFGAAYLGYLGVKLVLQPRSAFNASSADEGSQRRLAIDVALKRGFLTNMLNPKVGVFYVTFLPQFIPPEASVAAFSLLLTSVHVLLTLAWFAVLIALTVRVGRSTLLVCCMPTLGVSSLDLGRSFVGGLFMSVVGDLLRQHCSGRPEITRKSGSSAKA